MMEVFSKFRVSASSTYHEKQLDAQTLDAIDDNYLQRRQWSFYSSVLDNLDFTKKGPNPGKAPS